MHTSLCLLWLSVAAMQRSDWTAVSKERVQKACMSPHQGSRIGQAVFLHHASPSPTASSPVLCPAPAAEMEERVQGYPGPYVSDSDDEEEQQPTAEQDNKEEDLEEGLPHKFNTPEGMFDQSDNTDWLFDDVKDQAFLDQQQDETDSDEEDEGN